MPGTEKGHKARARAVRYLQLRKQLIEIIDDDGWSGWAARQRFVFAIQPGNGDADIMGAGHIAGQGVADVQHLFWLTVHGLQGPFKHFRTGFIAATLFAGDKILKLPAGTDGA